MIPRKACMARRRSIATNTRRGMTIIELLMLMSILAFVLGASIVQLQLLMKLGSDGRARAEGAASWDRLGAQFRLDLHDAASASPFAEKEETGLRITMDESADRRIEYRTGRDRIVRTETSNGKVTARESYAIPRLQKASFEDRAEGRGHLVALVVTRSTVKVNDAPARVEEILAAVNPTRSSKPGPAGEGKP